MKSLPGAIFAVSQFSILSLLHYAFAPFKAFPADFKGLTRLHERETGRAARETAIFAGSGFALVSLSHAFPR
jgi:hypothetical protein